VGKFFAPAAAEAGRTGDLRELRLQLECGTGAVLTAAWPVGLHGRLVELSRVRLGELERVGTGEVGK
jgi:hypothetical protein